MNCSWTRTKILLRRMKVLYEQGRSNEFNVLAERLKDGGVGDLNPFELQELKHRYNESNNQLIGYNEQAIKDLIESYSMAESKRWRQEVERRLYGILQLLQGISEYLEAEIDLESYDLSESEGKVEERVNRMQNFEDEYYKILVNANSWLIEDRNESIQLRERVEELIMTIRTTGI
ncbi:hypothetical protein [Vibrio harveyi]|uniref:hypothetical protein n=1 Tax=Vibrio harveyi TaxID=669 RepID=UPI003CF1403C